MRAVTALQIGVDGVGVIVDPAITPVGGEVFCVLLSAELIENFKRASLGASGGDPCAVDHRGCGDFFDR